jgi:cytoskeletal protein RodZ
VTGNEPPEDPSEAPTGYYASDSQEEGDPERGTPWYRRPIISLTLAGCALLVVGIGLYYLADQTQGTSETTVTPTSPTTSTPAPTTSTQVGTTTETTAAPTTTEPTTTSPTTTPPTTTTPPAEGHHHHHHHDGGTP